jgi:hypothetical protein
MRAVSGAAETDANLCAGLAGLEIAGYCIVRCLQDALLRPTSIWRSQMQRSVFTNVFCALQKTLLDDQITNTLSQFWIPISVY